MRKQQLVDGTSVLQRLHGPVQTDGIPERDGRDDQVQTAGSVALILEGPIADFTDAVQEDGGREGGVMRWKLKMWSCRRSAEMLIRVMLLALASWSTPCSSAPRPNQAAEHVLLPNPMPLEPSAANTPINFDIQGVHYRVPRNYVIYMDNWSGGPQTLVMFRVTFPGLAPLTAETQQCLEGPISLTGRQCARQDFFLTRGYPVSDEEGFRNFRSVFISQIPQQGPGGFEFYDTGPVTARIVTFRKRVDGYWLIFNCNHVPGIDGAVSMTYEKAVCTRHSRLPNGNELGYHFYEGQVLVVEGWEEGLRTLIHSFEATKK